MIFGYAPMDFQRLKVFLLDETGLAKDALHIYAGMAIFIAVRLLWRWGGGWIAAWLAALALACGAEYLDLRTEFSNSALQPDREHWHDIWNTMFWPTVLMLVGRWLQPEAKPRTGASGDLADQPFEEAPSA